MAEGRKSEALVAGDQHVARHSPKAAEASDATREAALHPSLFNHGDGGKCFSFINTGICRRALLTCSVR